MQVSIPGDISRLIQVLLEGCFNGKSEKVIRRQLAALLRVKPGKSVKSYHVLRNDMPEQLVKEMEEADKKRKEDQRARLLENKRRYMEEKAKLKADLLKTDGKETDEDVPPLQDLTNPEDADRNLFSDEDPLPLQDSFEQDAMPKANHTLLPLQDSLEDVIPEPKVREGKRAEAKKMEETSSIGGGREEMKKLKKKEKKEKKDNAEEMQEKKAVGKGREEMEKNQEAETANETQSQASTEQGAIPRQKKRKQDMEETQQIVEIVPLVEFSILVGFHHCFCEILLLLLREILCHLLCCTPQTFSHPTSSSLSSLLRTNMNSSRPRTFLTSPRRVLHAGGLSSLLL